MQEFTKKRLQQSSFPAKFAKCLRIASEKHLRRGTTACNHYILSSVPCMYKLHNKIICKVDNDLSL